MQKRIGILGSGQLGRMMFSPATALGLDIYFYGPLSGSIDFHLSQGDLQDSKGILDFALDKDIIGYEIESVNLEALQKLGSKVKPSAEILNIIQDKGVQKKFLQDHSYTTSSFEICSFQDLQSKDLQEKVIKITKGGYDGRGVWITTDASALPQDFEYVLEDKVDIQAEYAIQIARNARGELALYDPVEMFFDSKSNQLDYLICPAQISTELLKQMQEMAKAIANQVSLEGILSIEFFLDHKAKLFVNEMAPRVHNSGHHSIDAAETSQFEQYLRAICNLPLGSSNATSKSLCINLVGAENAEGLVDYGFREKLIQDPQIKLHWYGKTRVRPFRKMGHITILGETNDQMLAKLKQIRPFLKIQAESK